jgi:hypothetical protein
MRFVCQAIRAGIETVITVNVHRFLLDYNVHDVVLVHVI